MAKGTSGIRSAGGADKATIAASEALGPMALGGAGGVRKASHMARPNMGLTDCCESPLSQKECEGRPRAGPAEGGYIRTWKGHDPMKGTHLWRRRGNDASGHWKDATLQGVLKSWGPKREGAVGNGRSKTEQRALTSGGHRGGSTLQHRKKVTSQGVLTHGKEVAKQGVQTAEGGTWKKVNE